MTSAPARHCHPESFSQELRRYFRRWNDGSRDNATSFLLLASPDARRAQLGRERDGQFHKSFPEGSIQSRVIYRVAHIRTFTAALCLDVMYNSLIELTSFRWILAALLGKNALSLTQ
jgi:hypothetical protein